SQAGLCPLALYCSLPMAQTVEQAIPVTNKLRGCPAALASCLLALQPTHGETGQVRQPPAINCTGRQRVQEQLPVALADNPAVEDDDYAPVVFAADQATKPLTETQNGFRDRILVEWVLELLAAGGEERVAWHAERQAHDHEHAQVRARHVYTLPEGTCAHQHSLLCADEAFQKLRAAGTIALIEDDDALTGKRLSDGVGGLAKLGVAGKQHHRSPLRCAAQLQQALLDAALVGVALVRLRHIADDVEQRVVLVVE